MLESRVSRVSDMKPSFGTGSNGQRSSNDADSNSRERLACSKVEFWRVLKLSDVFDVENASRVRRLCACKNPKKKHFWKAVASLWRHVKMEGKHRLGSRLSAPGDPWLPAGDLPAWVSALGSGRPLAAGRRLQLRLRRPLAAGRKLQLRLRLLTAGRERLLRMRPRRNAR